MVGCRMAILLLLHLTEGDPKSILYSAEFILLGACMNQIISTVIQYILYDKSGHQTYGKMYMNTKSTTLINQDLIKIRFENEMCFSVLFHLEPDSLNSFDTRNYKIFWKTFSRKLTLSNSQDPNLISLSYSIPRSAKMCNLFTYLLSIF